MLIQKVIFFIADFFAIYILSADEKSNHSLCARIKANNALLAMQNIEIGM